MHWGRYLLAIAVGLAVGMAVGWYSGRVDDSQPQTARHHHHHRGSQAVNVHPPRRPDRSRPAPAPQTMRELQQQVLDCVLDHPMPAGQAACLRAVLRRELDAARDRWSGPSGGPLVLPFASLTQG